MNEIVELGDLVVFKGFMVAVEAATSLRNLPDSRQTSYKRVTDTEGKPFFGGLIGGLGHGLNQDGPCNKVAVINVSALRLHSYAIATQNGERMAYHLQYSWVLLNASIRCSRTD